MDFLRREDMQTRSIVEKIKRNTWCFSLLEKQAKLYSNSDLLSIKKSTNQRANHNHLILTKKVPDAISLGYNILPKQKIRSQPPSSWLSIKHFCPNFLSWNRACKCNVINAPQFTGAGGSSRGRLQFETYGCKEIPECFRDWQRGFLGLEERLL